MRALLVLVLFSLSPIALEGQSPIPRHYLTGLEGIHERFALQVDVLTTALRQPIAANAIEEERKQESIHSAAIAVAETFEEFCRPLDALPLGDA